ncbi:MAG: sulfotransferase, partial [bacterium]|nr:sulfotransferase [bacterium]
SFCSLVAHARGILSDHVDPLEIGRHWLRKTRRMADRSLQVRTGPGAGRFVDVSYYDLTSDPIAQLRQICEHAGIGFDDDAERAAEHCLEANPQNRHGRHIYRLDDFGLSGQVVDDAFASYRQRHAIPFE